MGLYDAAFIVGIVEYEQCGGVCGVGHYAPLSPRSRGCHLFLLAKLYTT